MAIEIKPSHKGLLHKDLGKPEGQKLTAADLAKAKNSSDPAVRKRATFAENAKHWNHSGSKKKKAKPKKRFMQASKGPQMFGASDNDGDESA